MLLLTYHDYRPHINSASVPRVPAQQQASLFGPGTNPAAAGGGFAPFTLGGYHGSDGGAQPFGFCCSGGTQPFAGSGIDGGVDAVSGNSALLQQLLKIKIKNYRINYCMQHNNM